MVRKVLAVAVIVAMALITLPTASVPLFAQGQLASIAGTASSNAGQTLANTTVQLRNLANGQLVGTTTSNAAGGFSFTGLQAGQYAIEVVNAAGQIVGTSAAITAAAGATITGVAVTATAAIAGAAGAAGAAAAAGGLGGIFGTTALIVTGVAVAGAVTAAVVIANNEASPSR